MDADDYGLVIERVGPVEELVDDPIQHVVFTQRGVSNLWELPEMSLGQKEMFVFYNTLYLKHYSDENRLDDTVSVRQAVDISYLRLLAVVKGMVSDRFDPAANFVSVNDAKFVPEDELRVFLQDDAGKNGRAEKIKAHLSVERRHYLGDLFPNLVGLVAVLFKLVGRHDGFLADNIAMHAIRLLRVDRKVLDLNWRMIAKFALHAIFPHVLEEFLERALAGNILHGTIVKLTRASPVGSHIIELLHTGLADVMATNAGVAAVCGGPLRHLMQLVEDYNIEPMAYGVHAELYGYERKRFDWVRVGALADMLLNAIVIHAPKSPIAGNYMLATAAFDSMMLTERFASAVEKLTLSEQPDVDGVGV